MGWAPGPKVDINNVWEYPRPLLPMAIYEKGKKCRARLHIGLKPFWRRILIFAHEQISYQNNLEKALISTSKFIEVRALKLTLKIGLSWNILSLCKISNKRLDCFVLKEICNQNQTIKKFISKQYARRRTRLQFKCS